MHFVDHLLEIKQGVKSSVGEWVRNPSTTGAEAVASKGRRLKSRKNAAKRPYLLHLLLDSTLAVNDNISPVVLPIRFPGTLVVAEVLNS